MRSRSLIMLLAVTAFTWGLFVVTAQEQDEEVRGAFLSSRPKTTNTSAKRRRRPPRTANTNTATATNKNANSGTSGAMNTNTRFSNQNSSNGGALTSIGLGYTLFMRDSSGRSIRVEPGHEFHNGDRMRISLEPNVDGYLYVFHTEGDGAPEMIYPDPRLDGGENWLEAHVPLEVPSSEESDERLRWFTFYGNPGTERLYIVVSRDPLPIVPTGEDLVKYCAGGKDKCPWHPSGEVWLRIQDGSKAEVKVVTTATFGQAQTEKEQVATTRGLGLDQTAPQPAVIRMNAATNAPVLVTVLDLVHK
jgi:Tfp pilus assembly major pilin PilA